MLQSQHIFSHQHQYPHTEPSWIHQPQHPHQAAQVHAQTQAAAAAANYAQQQHYNRIAATNNASAHALHADHGHSHAVMENGVSEENRRVLGWIAELMKSSSREAALLELSKKREQVPELALILWHSFGRCGTLWHSSLHYLPGITQKAS